MDLKTGAHYWPDHTSAPLRCPALRRDLTCDVAIVGGGLSGALCAYTLNQAGLEVVLLEKRHLGEGSTSASTALVLYEVDTPLTKLIRMHGRANAVRSYQCCLEAISALKQLTGKLPDQCEYRSRPSLYVASRKEDVEGLKKEFQVRKRSGFAVEYFTASDIADRFSLRSPAAIYSHDAAEVNPLALTCQLLAAVKKNAGEIYAKTEVSRFEEQQRQVIIHTRSGAKVSAKWVIRASGFETHERIVQKLVRLKSSYVTVTKPVKRFAGWPRRCLIWETKRPYFYTRTTADDRIIIGGGDEDFCDPKKRDRLIGRKAIQLASKLQRMFPDIPIQIAYQWAGTFGETKDGLPYIGRVKAGSRILYALCYGANGTNFAMLAAQILRYLISRKSNRDARLFAFDR